MEGPQHYLETELSFQEAELERIRPRGASKGPQRCFWRRAVLWGNGSKQMVQAPFQLHLHDQLSLGKRALGWKGAKGRRGEKCRHPERVYYSIFSHRPSARRWWSLGECRQPVRTFQVNHGNVGLLALGFASPGGNLSAPPHPHLLSGHPLWSICAGLLFAYAGAGPVPGQQETAGPKGAACVAAALLGNT